MVSEEINTKEKLIEDLIKKKKGRPSIYTPELAELICERLIDGESLRSICRIEGMPFITTVMNWTIDNKDFIERYARARALQAEGFADELKEISDNSTGDTIVSERGTEKCDNEWVQRSKLRVDTRKWIAARILPKVYGDKMALEHSGAITINHADRLLEARQRKEAALQKLADAVIPDTPDEQK